jgi:hypothetical protein
MLRQPSNPMVTLPAKHLEISRLRRQIGVRGDRFDVVNFKDNAVSTWRSAAVLTAAADCHDGVRSELQPKRRTVEIKVGSSHVAHSEEVLRATGIITHASAGSRKAVVYPLPPYIDFNWFQDITRRLTLFALTRVWMCLDASGRGRMPGDVGGA